MSAWHGEWRGEDGMPADGKTYDGANRAMPAEPWPYLSAHFPATLQPFHAREPLRRLKKRSIRWLHHSASA